MSLAHPRKITINDHEYKYIIKPERKSRYIGDTPYSIRVVLELDKKTYKTISLASKEYNPSMHDEGLKEHKNTFAPRDVKMLILKLLDKGEVKPGYEIGNWEVI